MKKREIAKMIRGQRAVDGAGVQLVRVLGHADVQDFDPFLMLDSFDSTNPSDYTAGFPMHPHRGIETITYLVSGEIEHQDSLGNKDSIRARESQWMTAGSGILHEEMPIEAGRMFGFQLWLNLPREEKMTDPGYLSITKEMMPQVEKDGALIRVLSGSLEGVSGVKPKHIKASIYDVTLPAGETLELPTNPEETVFIFSLEGDAVIGGEAIPAKTAVLFEKGDFISVSAAPNTELRFMFYSAKPLHEPISWGGPIVMNTEEELRHAFTELRQGSFIKHS